MLTLSSIKIPVRVALLAGGIGLAFTAAASAQEYDRYGNQVAYHDNSPPEEVTIYAPRHLPDRSDIGAPIVNVALSRAVRYDDLDLTTGWGARRLNDRIRETARVLCRQIDLRYVPVEGDRGSCYRQTVADAQDRVDEAIDRARSDY
jgi:UrcA family protein